MSAPPLLFPNLGAEEGEAWRRMARHPRVRDAARSWRALFAADARLVGADEPLDGALGEPFAGGASGPALALAGARDVLVAWLATDEAAALAAREGVPLAGPPPRAVAAVHDKAFALEAARAAGLLPAELAETAFALAPGELVDADTAKCRVEGAVARWPAELRTRFVLKPRLGTSGRGRLAGRAGRLDRDALAAALARFRSRAGVVVEPWLEREADLSAQLDVRGPDDVQLLATFVQVLTPEGVPRGHRARIGADGRAESATPWDAELRLAAGAVARAAAAAGYRGPCGVDAFAFRGAGGAARFRAVVELNARFTSGTGAAGWVARALRGGLIEPGSELYLGAAPAPFDAHRVELFAAPGESALFVAR